MLSEALKLNTNITSLYLRGEKKNTKKLVSNLVIMSFNSSSIKKENEIGDEGKQMVRDAWGDRTQRLGL